MSAFDDSKEMPRRVMTVFFLVDSSGSMEGDKMASVNIAIRETLPELKEIAEKNADAKIKIACLEFATGIEWMYPEPLDAETFQWRDLVAKGATSFGEACHELNSKLSKTKGFMTNATGSYAPVIILLTDGMPNDNWEKEVEKLWENGWFKNAIKIAICIGVSEDKYQEVFIKFTRSKEHVLTVHDRDTLKDLIKYVTVSSTQIQSKSSSVGIGAPESKIDEFSKNLEKELETNQELEKVDIGVDVTPYTDSDWDAGNY